ncbi:unnamed protein product [Adineta ricciae]|uniref:G-protein coupled receptors family 1 profile domain-containing protein n=2 Tax=Adineta ricciae TaxID=249248 RepID=A0A814SY12_ADIRI|nr:unnamed protein product [Adineta ricciae]
MPVTNLPLIQQAMTRYGMSFYLGLGVIGNACGCIMFTRQTYRRTASSVYFLCLSICSIMYLIWSLFPYLYSLDHIDPQKQSIAYCKTRFYGTHLFGQCVRYSIVLACIDRYFCTRTSMRLRSFSSISIAVKLVLIMISVWLIVSIHILVFMEIRNNVCGMFDAYKLFYAAYQITFISVVPPTLMSIFSILTFRSLRQRHDGQAHIRQRDRQLMRILIVEVLINVSTSIPISCNFAYNAATIYVTDKTSLRQEIESFFGYIVQNLIYLISVVPFYVFLITSKPFRNEFFDIFVNLWNKHIRRRTRIVPFAEQDARTRRTHTILRTEHQ